MATPYNGYCSFTNLQFELAIQLRLMLPLTLYKSWSAANCNCTAHTRLDCMGDHALKCVQDNGMKNRHNLMERMLMALVKEARLSGKMEPRKSLFTYDHKELIPEVIIYDSPTHKGATVALDVSIVHPLAGTTVNKAAKKKVSKYSPSCSASGQVFIPMVWSALGAIDDAALAFLNSMFKVIADALHVSYSTVKYKWTRILSCCLQRANAQTLIGKYDAIKTLTSASSCPMMAQLEYLDLF